MSTVLFVKLQVTFLFLNSLTVQKELTNYTHLLYRYISTQIDISSSDKKHVFYECYFGIEYWSKYMYMNTSIILYLSAYQSSIYFTIDA